MNLYPFFVFILNTEATRPVFHEHGEIKVENHGEPNERWISYTKCGHSMDPFFHVCARLRADHALLFARPCRKCFP